MIRSALRGAMVTSAVTCGLVVAAPLAVNSKGDLAYTTSDFAGTARTLTIKKGHGGTVVADLAGYEAAKNPDGRVSYGIDKPTPCQVKAFEPLGGATYKGIVDSHPYAVRAWGSGWIVADAGMNALVRVDGKGRVSTLAVLPRQPTKITADAAGALDLP